LIRNKNVIKIKEKETILPELKPSFDMSLILPSEEEVMAMNFKRFSYLEKMRRNSMMEMN
jgi:hypothetical protein